MCNPTVRMAPGSIQQPENTPLAWFLSPKPHSARNLRRDVTPTSVGRHLVQRVPAFHHQSIDLNTVRTYHHLAVASIARPSLHHPTNPEIETLNPEHRRPNINHQRPRHPLRRTQRDPIPDRERRRSDNKANPMAPFEQAAAISPRQFGSRCDYGYHYSSSLNRCVRDNGSRWYDWGRWVLAGIVVVFFILTLLLLA